VSVAAVTARARICVAIMREATRQMLAAGSSPNAIVHALTGCVLNHPACLADNRRNIVTGQPHSGTLVEMVRQSVARATLEAARPG